MLFPLGSPPGTQHIIRSRHTQQICYRENPPLRSACDSDPRLPVSGVCQEASALAHSAVQRIEHERVDHKPNDQDEQDSHDDPGEVALPGAAGKTLVRYSETGGMGGEGVWKVELDGQLVRVQHAARGSVPQRLPLDEFVRSCEPYFAGTGLMVEQPFQARLDEGMIRVYLTHGQVVGFAHQYPSGLMDAPQPQAAKSFELASAAAYSELRVAMESEWVPQLQKILEIETHSLPVIWDADFLFGPKNSSGADTYVLCEINASSTFAFPEHAMPTVAQAAISRIKERRA